MSDLSKLEFQRIGYKTTKNISVPDYSFRLIENPTYRCPTYLGIPVLCSLLSGVWEDRTPHQLDEFKGHPELFLYALL